MNNVLVFGFILYGLTVLIAIVTNIMVFIGAELNDKMFKSKTIMNIWLACSIVGFAILLYGLYVSPVGLRCMPNSYKLMCGAIVLMSAIFIRIALCNILNEWAKQYKYFINVSSAVLVSLAVLVYLVIA